MTFVSNKYRLTAKEAKEHHYFRSLRQGHIHYDGPPLCANASQNPGPEDVAHHEEGPHEDETDAQGEQDMEQDVEGEMVGEDEAQDIDTDAVGELDADVAVVAGEGYYVDGDAEANFDIAADVDVVADVDAEGDVDEEVMSWDENLEQLPEIDSNFANALMKGLADAAQENKCSSPNEAGPSHRGQTSEEDEEYDAAEDLYFDEEDNTYDYIESPDDEGTNGAARTVSSVGEDVFDEGVDESVAESSQNNESESSNTTESNGHVPKKQKKDD